MEALVEKKIAEGNLQLFTNNLSIASLPEGQELQRTYVVFRKREFYNGRCGCVLWQQAETTLKSTQRQTGVRTKPLKRDRSAGRWQSELVASHSDYGHVNAGMTEPP
jgi:hypothetical protein